MPEKFNFIENRDTDAGWALISVLSVLSDEEKTKAIHRDADGNYDILLTVNGVECKFSHIIERLNEGFKRRVNIQAARMIHTLCEKEFMAMTEVLDEAKQKLRDLCNIPDDVEPTDYLTVDDILNISKAE